MEQQAKTQKYGDMMEWHGNRDKPMYFKYVRTATPTRHPGVLNNKPGEGREVVPG